LSGRKLERRYFVYDGPGVTGWVIKTPVLETLGAEAGESATDSFINRCSYESDVFVPEYPTIDKRRYGILMIGLAESHVLPV